MSVLRLSKVLEIFAWMHCTNNGTLTISTPLWVTQMRGLRNLYLSYPPLFLWVMLVYIHPLRVTLVYFHPVRVTLVYFHPLRVTLVYFHPPRVTHVYIHPPRVTLRYATPGSSQGYTGISVYMAMASPHVSNTPRNRCPSGLHASFLSVPQLTPITVSCQSQGLNACLCNKLRLTNEDT